MARVQEQPDHAADDDADEEHSGSDSENDSAYDSDSSDSDDSNSNSEEDITEEEEDAVEMEAAAAAKEQRVQADIVEMRHMMADMDAIKVRIQHRLATERQVRQQSASEDREREVQNHRAEKEARGRRVETAVQTDAIVSQHQLNLSQQGFRTPHRADSAAGNGAPPAVNGDTGFADAAPKRVKPAGLSLYDLVKTTGVGVLRKAPSSPVRQADPLSLPLHYTHKHEQESPRRQPQDYNEQLTACEKQAWSSVNSQSSQDQDSIVGDCENDSLYHAAVSNPAQSQRERASSFQCNENSASMSNSLVTSSDSDKQSANQNRQENHKFNAAALLSTGTRAESVVNASDNYKTDEQREMDAIQFLLFGRIVQVRQR